MLTFKRMNFIDMIIALPLLWAVYRGFCRGFIVELAALVGFWIGIWGSLRFSGELVPMLKKHLQTDPSLLPVIAFFILFLLIILVIHLLSRLIQKTMEGMALGLLNKLTGALFGFLKCAVLISVVIFVLDTCISLPQKKESILYTTLGRVGPSILPQLKELR
jgi:membrane protein required for colicin V production